MNKDSILYLECNSGISGDMTVAALLDLGADEQILRNVLKTIPVKEFSINISRVKKSGLDMCDFDVILDKHHDNYDHDMEYLHGKDVKQHNDETNHPHEHHHAHEHRGLQEILHIIDHTDMTESARGIAKQIFNILAQAESKAHGIPINEVHFHEVGAVDSIVDIISVAVCIDNLGVSDCIVPYICEGTGTVRCQHGVLPVPVPAVSNIVAANGIALKITDTQGEFVTPTGAAVVAAVKTSEKLPSAFTITRIGMGAGKRKYERPSILRAMLIKDVSRADKTDSNSKTSMDYIYKLESNIDDCTGESLGYVMDRLLKAGARDVHYMPVYMKKNRPAYQLNVICKEAKITELEQIIFEETTTIGIRRQKMDRSILERHIEMVSTSIGDAKVKVCYIEGVTRVYPEYESVIELCNKNNMAYQDVYRLIERESEKDRD